MYNQGGHFLDQDRASSTERKAASFTRLPLSTTVKAQLKGVVMKLQFQESFKTEVFVTESGHIRISQTGDYGEELYVLLSPEQAEKLLEALPDLIDMARLQLVAGYE